MLTTWTCPGSYLNVLMASGGILSDEWPRREPSGEREGEKEKRERKGREGSRGGGEKDLWTRESGVVYTEIKIKAVTVNEVSEESEIKYMEERETLQ